MCLINLWCSSSGLKELIELLIWDLATKCIDSLSTVNHINGWNCLNLKGLGNSSKFINVYFQKFYLSPWFLYFLFQLGGQLFARTTPISIEINQHRFTRPCHYILPIFLALKLNDILNMFAIKLLSIIFDLIHLCLSRLSLLLAETCKGSLDEMSSDWPGLDIFVDICDQSCISSDMKHHN